MPRTAGVTSAPPDEPPGPDGMIAVDDPRTRDIRDLLQRHLEFAGAHGPPEDVHALPAHEVADPAVTFVRCRHDGGLLGVGALRHLDCRHAELKSMHVAQAARGRGAGRAILRYLIDLARARGYERVSLETGSMAAFAPARSLYASAGFRPCEPLRCLPPEP